MMVDQPNEVAVEVNIALFGEVAKEVVASTMKHGPQRDVPLGGGRPHNQFAANVARSRTDRRASVGEVTWEDILREELEEAFAETTPEGLRAEMVQVAAVAVKIIDAIDHGATLTEGGDRG